MMTLALTTTILGAGLAAAILYLLRQDRLQLRHGVFWLAMAGSAALLAIWPASIDALARVAGISYPPTLLLLGAVIVLLLKGLLSDIEHTRLQRDVRRLNQRIAMLEAKGVQDGERG